MNKKAKEEPSMTPVKEKIVELINRLPDKQVIYVFNILHNIEELAQSADRNAITHKPQVSDISETMLLSETALAKDWLIAGRGRCIAQFVNVFVTRRR
jgi:ABC-type transporter Mla maintaining outer membrane lipid asymmetry ATPase subunit MlaF